jgi:hypothetical protein
MDLREQGGQARSSRTKTSFKESFELFSVISISGFEGNPDMLSASGSEGAVVLRWAYAWPASGYTGRQKIRLLEMRGLMCLFACPPEGGLGNKLISLLALSNIKSRGLICLLLKMLIIEK